MIRLLLFILEMEDQYIRGKMIVDMITEEGELNLMLIF